MKKFFYILLAFFAVSFGTIALASCNDRSNTSDVDSAWEEKVKFENKTYEYDGNAHSIAVTGAPEDAEIRYTGNDKIKPGEYRVFARVKYNGKELSLNAIMTIDKITSVITAEEKQVFYTCNNDVRPLYKLNNEEQSVNIVVKQGDKIVSENSLYKVGSYTVELQASKTTYYKDSNLVTIQVEVKESQFSGVSFTGLTTAYDGNEKEITLTGTLPDGYSVVYENNKNAEVGTYFAKAIIKDMNGVVIEEHRAILDVESQNNTVFEEYLDNFFIEYLEGDQLSVNIFCEKPQDFGLEHYTAKWYTYTPSENYEQDMIETRAYFKALLDELHTFNVDFLNSRQQIAYNQIDSFLKYQNQYYAIDNIDYLENHYIDQFGGYVADFGTYMEAYTLRGKQEVDDIVDFIVSTKTAFPSYLLYIDAKTKAGYPLSNYTIKEMTNYLDEVLSNHNPSNDEYYYLQEVLCDKIEKVDFLSAEEKTEYKNKIISAFANEFIPGVLELRDGLQTYLNILPTEKEGYWASYENGSELFQMELEKLLGLENFSMTDYVREVQTAFATYSDLASDALQVILTKYKIQTNAELSMFLSSHAIFDGTPTEMIGYLKEFATTIVPTLENTPNITIKEMDLASAKVSNAVAYYMKSALDNDKQEYITLNPVKLGDKNDVLGTMSHEGYPGHLYAYIYSKQLNLHNISKIMTSTAHGEGWATYVELKLYEYAMANTTDQALLDTLNYLYYNHLSSFLLETRLDAGIHYEGWDIAETRNFLKRNGYNSDAAEDIYNLLIETPVSYAAYGYGKLFFYNLHQEAKEILGGFYDEIDFNS
ncbi:MAG: DUF885 domain-containing protein, partial [Anaeroplasmataceae bacterium]|nr:DUF885 domain-containing protein [Anaeroplasmataceae bacterium]